MARPLAKGGGEVACGDRTTSCLEGEAGFGEEALLPTGMLCTATLRGSTPGLEELGAGLDAQRVIGRSATSSSSATTAW